jgi:hypothetical protein
MVGALASMDLKELVGAIRDCDRSRAPKWKAGVYQYHVDLFSFARLHEFVRTAEHRPNPIYFNSDQVQLCRKLAR